MISLRRVSKSFESSAGAVNALEDVSLDVRKGEIFGIIGRSGAGKSTLVRLINALERPTQGEVLFGTEVISYAQGVQLRRLRRKIGMIFQHFNLLSSRTVAGNVSYPLELDGGLSRQAREERVAKLLARVSLSAHAHKYPRELSGGQKQRVGIARALASEPEVLLCDEATSALDPESTESILSLLEEINREYGLTVIIITHEMDVVRRICDRVAVLDHGRLVEAGPVREVFLTPAHETTRAILFGNGGALDTTSAEEPSYLLTLFGENTHSEVPSRILREHDVDFAILSGRVGKIRHEPFLQLVLRLNGKGRSKAVAALLQRGFSIQEQGGPLAENAREGGLRVA